jgi:hypothetical protein
MEHAPHRPTLALEVLPDVLCVARLDPDAPVPASVLRSSGLVSLTRTEEELSVVCREHEAPARARVERGWRALRVAGPLEFALAGVLASLAQPLADAEISVFAVSTYDTDYLLVRDVALDRAVRALEAAGHRVTR